MLHSTTSQNELEAFRDRIRPLNELERFDRETLGTARGEMPEILAVHLLPGAQLSNPTSSLSELPTCPTNGRPENIDSASRVSAIGPGELGNSEHYFQDTQMRPETEQGHFQSSVHELDVHSISAALECNPTRSCAPEAILHSGIGDQRPSNVAPEYTTVAPTSGAPQRQSPVVTFSYDRPSSCEENCACICHFKHRSKSPEIAKSLIGSLFIGYTGLPFLFSKCNSDTCIRQSSRSIRVWYTFPTWFIQRTLDVLVRSATMSGFCFRVTMRNRVNMGAGINMISLARHGDIVTMIKLLENRKGSLSDIEMHGGLSPFFVRL